MTSSNGNIFRVTGGEFTGHQSQRPVTRRLDFVLICAWTISWANNRDAGDLRRYRAHYDNTVIMLTHIGVELGHQYRWQYLNQWLSKYKQRLSGKCVWKFRCQYGRLDFVSLQCVKPSSRVWKNIRLPNGARESIATMPIEKGKVFLPVFADFSYIVTLLMTIWLHPKSPSKPSDMSLYCEC